MKRKITTIYKVSASLSIRKKQTKVIPFEVIETPKLFKVSNHQDLAAIGWKMQIKKTELNIVDSLLKNAIDNNKGMIEFHALCLEKDIDTTKKTVQNKLTEHFNAIKKSVDEMYLKLICI